MHRYLAFLIRSTALSFASFLQASLYGLYEKLFDGSRAGSGNGTIRILVVQLGQIGDFVLTAPLFSAFKQEYGEKVSLNVMTDSINAGLARSNSDIDRLILYNSPKYTRGEASSRLPADLENEMFDRVLWLRGDTKMFLWTVFRRMPMTSVIKYPNPLRWAWLPLITGSPVRKRFNHFVESLDGLDKAAKPSKAVKKRRSVEKSSGVTEVYMHIGSGSELRKWPKENFTSVCERLVEWDGSIVINLLGSKSDRDVAELIKQGLSERVNNLCGSLSLTDLFGAFARGDLYIGFDSGPMHIAASSGIPIVALMGPQSPQLFRPWSDQEVRVIYKYFYCSPCWQFSCLYAENGPGACVLAIKPDEVFDEAKAILENRRVRKGGA